MLDWSEPASPSLAKATIRPVPPAFDNMPTGAAERTGDLAAARATLARATVELLGGPGADQLKECVGERCTRLFLDSSRRGTRRWCDMSECGNRAKAAAYRGRHTPA